MTRMTEETDQTMQAGRALLPKDRSILEQEFMKFRPFGSDEQGHTI